MQFAIVCGRGPAVIFFASPDGWWMPIVPSGTAPVDFAQHIFRRLDLYPPAVLDAWYGLFKTGHREYFDALIRAVSA